MIIQAEEERHPSREPGGLAAVCGTGAASVPDAIICMGQRQPVICGIDPGGRQTGVVWVCEGQLEYHNVYERGPGEDDAAYIDRFPWAAGPIPDLICVEDVRAPVGQMGQISLDGLLRTAVTLGAVLAYAASGGVPVVVVPPGAHGSGPVTAYPVELRPTRGSGAGHDRLRHCRSAWDLAIAGERLSKLRER